MQKRKKIYTGYAVVSEDFTSVSFGCGDLEICKEYCRNGYVIARSYQKKLGYNFRICWMKWYKPFIFSPKWREINILWLYIRWNVIYTDRWEHEVFWRPNNE